MFRHLEIMSGAFYLVMIGFGVGVYYTVKEGEENIDIRDNREMMVREN